MHPAPSIIAFTTASGAGYGLLFLAILAAIAGGLPESGAFAFATMAVGVGLVGAGLLSSTLHLGHPERAWRALSQWRSSWLSREGVAAILTFVPLAVFGIGWVFVGETGGAWAVAGLLAAAGCVVTVGCTAMIYSSLKTIRAWNTPWAVAIYFLMALASGSLLLAMLTRLFQAPATWIDVLALVFLALAWAAKLAYWRDIDEAPARSTPESATGLGNWGRVRPILPPHTEENYLLKEMGFRVARKHSAKLRRFALAAGFAVPAVAVLLALLFGGGVAAGLAVVAVAAAGIGILLERWLFFAEARHTVMLYYEGAAG